MDTKTPKTQFLRRGVVHVAIDTNTSHCRIESDDRCAFDIAVSIGLTSGEYLNLLFAVPPNGSDSKPKKLRQGKKKREIKLLVHNMCSTGGARTLVTSS